MQAKSLDQLMGHIKEEIELCLEVVGSDHEALLKGMGLEVKKVKDSHYFLKHPDDRTTVIPVHSRKTLGPALLARLLRDLQMSRQVMATG